jgi:hypothetical protein
MAAVDAARHSLDLSMTLYVKGATDYLTVVTSQAAVLQTQLEALNLDTLQLRASVDLIRALGGGWEDSATAQNSTAKNRPTSGQAPPTPAAASQLCSSCEQWHRAFPAGPRR